MPDESLKSDTTDLKDNSKAEQTMERLKVSAEWLEGNFWGEMSDAFRAYEVRAEQLVYPKGHPRAGKEDRTRTNVAMPEIFTGVRRKAVRKSRRPPTIKVRSKDPQVAEMFSHLATLQWDRAGEQRHQRRHVLQGDLLGISLKVHYYDQVSQQRTLRYAVDKILDRLYAKIEQNNDSYNVFLADEGDPGAIRADKLSPEDQAAFLSNVGPEASMPQSFSRFDGPLSDWIFFGDWYPEPEFDSIHASAWHIFEGVKDAEWLAYMAKQTFKDPFTGEQRPIIDPKKLDELEEYKPLRSLTSKTRSGGTDKDFRQTLRDVIYKVRPEVEARLIPGRRYLIHQEYTFRKGICWVRFIGSEKIMLGEMCLPWDLGGRYPISAYTPMPSLLHGIGDSTARKGRHLWKLHNVNFSQRTDIITNALKKILALPIGSDIPDEMMDTGLFRVLFTDNYKEVIAALAAPTAPAPADATQLAQEIMRMLQMLEPAMIDFGTESQAVPNSQRVATLGLLQQRASDAIGSDELEALNDSIAEETDIKLTMWQQMMTTAESGAINEFWTIETPAGSSHPRKSISDPLELQQDFEVFPELGSTLALDDQMRKQSAQEIYDRAIGAPTIWNVQEAARRLASTYGVPNPEELLAQPPPPEPPKMSYSVSIKVEPDPQESAQILEKIGVTPSEDTELSQLYDHVEKAAGAAESAQKLLGDHPEQAPPEPKVSGNGVKK